MKTNVLKVLKSGLAAGLLVLCAGGLAPVRADNLTASYGLYWNGIRIFSMEAEGQIGPDRYGLRLAYRTRGLARLFSKGQGEVAANGLITDGGGILAQDYLSRGRWDGEDFSRTVRFGADGRMAAVEESWPAKWREEYPQEPVPAEMQMGPDPTSMMVAMLLSVAPDAGSPGTLRGRAFDGDSVREWQFTCASEPTVLEASSHSSFAGDAYECRVSAKVLAGQLVETDKQRKKREKRERKEAEKREKGKGGADDPLRLWVAAPEGSPYVLPVRAELPSGFGKLHFFLDEFGTRADM